MAGQSFTVTELQRGSDGSLREKQGGVRFDWNIRNRALPRQAWDMPVKLRTVRENYPGGGVTEQVLGSHFEPFTLSGMWDDRYGGEGFAVRNWKEFEALALRGPPVRIAFEEIVFVGLMTDLTTSYLRRERIGYEFTVSPHYRDKPEPNRVASKKVAPIRNYAETIAGAVQAARNIHNQALPHYIAGALYATVGDIVASVEAKANEIAAVIDRRVLVVSAATPGVSAPPLSASGGTAEGSVGRVVAALGVLAADAMRLPRAVASSGGATDAAFPGEVIEAEVDAWTRELATQMRIVAVTAREALRELRQRIQPDAQAIYLPKEGESLYAVSTRFYGTPHQWRKIMEANNVYASTFAGTEVLSIPQ